MKIENKNNKLPFNRRRREITNLVGIIVILLFLLMVFWLYLEQAVTVRFALFLALGLLWGLFSMIKELYKWNMLVFAEDGLYKEKYTWFHTDPYELQLMVKWRDVRYIELLSVPEKWALTIPAGRGYRCNVIIIHGVSSKKSYYLDLNDYYCDDWPGKQYDERLIEMLRPICRNHNFELKLT